MWKWSDGQRGEAIGRLNEQSLEKLFQFIVVLLSEEGHDKGVNQPDLSAGQLPYPVRQQQSLRIPTAR